MRTLTDSMEDIYPLLEVIRLAKACINAKNLHAFSVIRGFTYQSSYDQMEIIQYVLGEICDYFTVSDCEEDDVEAEAFYFSDAAIRDYYRLCRERSRLMGHPFGEDPYTAKAEQMVNEWLSVNGCYYCYAEVSIDHDQEYGYGIRFAYDPCNFWEFGALAERMTYLLNDFREAALPLRREVEQLKRQVALVPVSTQTALRVIHHDKKRGMKT